MLRMQLRCPRARGERAWRDALLSGMASGTARAKLFSYRKHVEFNFILSH